jgi:hypothetical protein
MYHQLVVIFCFSKLDYSDFPKSSTVVSLSGSFNPRPGRRPAETAYRPTCASTTCGTRSRRRWRMPAPRCTRSERSWVTASYRQPPAMPIMRRSAWWRPHPPQPDRGICCPVLQPTSVNDDREKGRRAAASFFLIDALALLSYDGHGRVPRLPARRCTRSARPSVTVSFPPPPATPTTHRSAWWKPRRRRPGRGTCCQILCLAAGRRDGKWEMRAAISHFFCRHPPSDAHGERGPFTRQPLPALPTSLPGRLGVICRLGRWIASLSTNRREPSRWCHRASASRRLARVGSPSHRHFIAVLRVASDNT